MNHSFDAAIIGGGIVGTATAMKLLKKYPRMSIAVLEKEERLASHQTGHNSGVIHSGIYYRPGSLKARLCISGAQELVQFCMEQGIHFELCGKVVVATRPEEIPRLHELHRRGTANGVSGMKLLSPAQVREYEPYTRCLEGMHVPTTGIVDYRQVADAYADVFRASGGQIFTSHRVIGIHRKSTHIDLDTTGKAISTKLLINCGGLYSDRLAKMAGMEPPCQIVPFRGEYYKINPERSFMVKTLIYPVPDPRFPFLGVHFTRMIDGKVEAGPNAVLAWAREGYEKGRISIPELHEIFAYSGFWHLALRYFKPAWQEMVRSYSKSRFTRALQQLIPEIRSKDLSPGGAGVRAQALGKNGTLLDDFVIMKTERMVHVLNAPSPAATSALAIAGHIVEIASSLI